METEPVTAAIDHMVMSEEEILLGEEESPGCSNAHFAQVEKSNISRHESVTIPISEWEQ